MEKEKINLETMDGMVIEGELIGIQELNRIAINSCLGLTYLMNIIDGSGIYMWFKDDRTGVSYFMEIK